MSIFSVEQHLLLDSGPLGRRPIHSKLNMCYFLSTEKKANHKSGVWEDEKLQSDDS